MLVFIYAYFFDQKARGNKVVQFYSGFKENGLEKGSTKNTENWSFSESEKYTEGGHLKKQQNSLY